MLWGGRGGGRNGRRGGGRDEALRHESGLVMLAGGSLGIVWGDDGATKYVGNCIEMWVTRVQYQATTG